MELQSFISFMLENAEHGWQFLKSNWDPAKALPIAFAALSALWGVYLKWRNTGYRQLDRLNEFLEKQEKRVGGARDELGRLVKVPSPIRSLDSPAFSAKALDQTLWLMNWGYGSAAANDLKDATRICLEKAELSRKQSIDHEARGALAELLLGARAAAECPTSIDERNAARSRALEHFNAALRIYQNDPEALEYSGMMLLELANPAGAIDRFEKLVQVRGPTAGFPLSRAYRMLATAYEKLPTPMLGNANQSMLNAILHIPQEMLLERALTHEHHGQIRRKLGFSKVANDSFQEAAIIYRHQQLRNTPEGKSGLERVIQALADLNIATDNYAAVSSSPNGSGGAPLVMPERQGFFAMFRPNS